MDISNIKVRSIRMDSSFVSPFSILGTDGDAKLIDNINRETGGASFFNTEHDPFRNRYQHFLQQVITPMQRDTKTLVSNVRKAMTIDDVYEAINTLDMLNRGVPSKMQLPIVYYHPIRKMLEEGRIDGFGYDPTTLRSYDPYEHILASGYAEYDYGILKQAGGKLTYTFERRSDDPDLSDDDVEAIRSTRQFIDKFYDNDLTKNLDFTNYPNLHC